MLRCWWIRRDLTALVDGELSEYRASAVQRHLAGCEACAEQRRGLEAVVALQRAHLPRLFGAADVAAEPLLLRIRQEVTEVRSPRVAWARQPMVAAAAVFAGVLLFSYMGLFEPVLVATGVQGPPEVVAEQPEMFRDYAMFEHLEAIENLEAVVETPRKPPNGEPQG